MNLGSNATPNHIVVLGQVNAAYSIGRAPWSGHRIRRNGSLVPGAWPGRIWFPSVMRALTSSSSLSIPMAMMPRAITLEKSLSGVFLTCVARGEKMNLPSFKIATGRMARTFSPAAGEQALHRLPFPARPRRNLVDLDPVHAPALVKQSRKAWSSRRSAARQNLPRASSCGAPSTARAAVDRC